MRKLQRKRGARRALLKNLATSLILYEKVKTTLEKAKEISSLVERLIHKGKRRDLASRRYLLRFLPKNAVLKIIEDLAPSFSNRESGYLRILKIRERRGDGARMAQIEFVERPLITEKIEEEPKARKEEPKARKKLKEVKKEEKKDERKTKRKK